MLDHVLRALRPRKGADIRWVNARLAIGGASRDEDWRDVCRAGVSAVVDLRDDQPGSGTAVRANGMRYLRLCLNDRGVPRADELQIVTSWVLERMAEDGRVLIQDGYAGFNDGLVAVATLIKDGLPAHLALLALRRAMPGHSFDAIQNAALVRFAEAQAATP